MREYINGAILLKIDVLIIVKKEYKLNVDETMKIVFYFYFWLFNYVFI